VTRAARRTDRSISPLSITWSTLPAEHLCGLGHANRVYARGWSAPASGPGGAGTQARKWGRSIRGRVGGWQGHWRVQSGGVKNGWIYRFCSCTGSG